MRNITTIHYGGEGEEKPLSLLRRIYRIYLPSYLCASPLRVSAQLPTETGGNVHSLHKMVSTMKIAFIKYPIRLSEYLQKETVQCGQLDKKNLSMDKTLFQKF